MFGLASVAGDVYAFPESGKVGQNVDEDHPEGTVTRVEFQEEDDGWYLIMPYRGDFDGDPYLDDGWIINVWTDREGNAWVYMFVHDTDPRFTGENPIWGSWDWFLGTGGGKDWQEDSGVFTSNR
ncbi:MAG: hypothetical protein ACOC6Q_00420 [Patescibacteria group bacterium]